MTPARERALPFNRRIPPRDAALEGAIEREAVSRPILPRASQITSVVRLVISRLVARVNAGRPAPRAGRQTTHRAARASAATSQQSR